MIDPEAPVGNPADFVGQAGLVRRVLSRVGAGRPQSVAVIGGKKSGKTSLLAYLADSGVTRRHLDEVGKYLFVSLRAERGRLDDPEAFLGCVAEQLALGARHGSNRYEELRSRIESLHADGRCVIVFLDDFHYITRSDRFPLEFFSFLRSMASNYNVAYVTTSLLELQMLCVAKEVQESPFFNIFTNMHIGMLAPEDALALFARITGSESGTAERMVAWCGGAPYVLKKAGAWLSARAVTDAVTDAVLEKSLFPEVAPYFEEVLSFLAPEAFRPLQAVLKNKAPDPSEEHHLGALAKQGFLVEDGDGLSPYSPAFELFLRKRLSPKMLKGNC